MFNHVMVGASDIEKARTFYTAVLGVLGAGEPVENTNAKGDKRLFYVHDGNRFGISEPINGKPATGANGGTIGFKCSSPEQVVALHDAAIANGGTSIEDAPGPRRGGEVHLSYFLDPDGNKLCGIYRP